MQLLLYPHVQGRCLSLSCTITNTRVSFMSCIACVTHPDSRLFWSVRWSSQPKRKGAPYPVLGGASATTALVRVVVGSPLKKHDGSRFCEKLKEIMLGSRPSPWINQMPLDVNAGELSLNDVIKFAPSFGDSCDWTRPEPAVFSVSGSISLDTASLTQRVAKAIPAEGYGSPFLLGCFLLWTDVI
ncbi:hypothetical protein M8C21_018718 [Ambrosia artemisiifolia]|uniref:Uncharacterized protein n=1 Tax=Ambrosia artemisiifolia TaxID=4212 RepID=A0AAD5DDV5_AMBAR|nr:hypothetical protein M8C21_018718 [Ambrosia artemisiifolia]